MEVRRNNKLHAFNIRVGQEELKRAFESETGYLIFLHTLVALTYGDDLAQQLFPINKK